MMSVLRCEAASAVAHASARPVTRSLNTRLRSSMRDCSARTSGSVSRLGLLTSSSRIGSSSPSRSASAGDEASCSDWRYRRLASSSWRAHACSAAMSTVPASARVGELHERAFRPLDVVADRREHDALTNRLRVGSTRHSGARGFAVESARGPDHRPATKAETASSATAAAASHGRASAQLDRRAAAAGSRGSRRAHTRAP